jgi:multiple sugar transport system substrate-binding protein
MNLRIPVLILVGALLLAGLAIFAEQITTRQADPSRTTVIYWEKWTGQEADEMRKVVEAFNKSQDKIVVKYLSISGVDSKTMLATAGGTPPDIAGVWDNDVVQFSEAGALTDLTEMANQAKLTRDYYIPGYYDALTYKGKLWALPSTPASMALHVRSDLVPKEFATPETFPKTLEGLDALSDRISVVKKDGTLELAGFLPSDPGWWTWAWPGLFGGSLVVNGEPKMNSPESIRSFTWAYRYAKKFGAKEVQSFQSGFGNFASPQDSFMEGKVASQLNGVWKANYVRVFHPGLKWFAVPFPYPADRPDLAGHSILAQDILVIPHGAAHPTEAFEFIKFMQRQDVMEGLCSGHGKNSPLAKVSEAFFHRHPNPYIRLFDQLARSPKSISIPQIGVYPQLGSEVGVAFQEVMGDQKSPKQALDDAQARIDKLWKVYKVQVLGGKSE